MSEALKEYFRKRENAAYNCGAEDVLNLIVSEMERGTDIGLVLKTLRASLIEHKERQAAE